MSNETKPVRQVTQRAFDDIPGLSDQALLVTSVGVGQASNQDALVVSFGCLFQAQKDGLTHQFVLSPPAAHQLARQLKETLKAYLRGDRDET